MKRITASPINAAGKGSMPPEEQGIARSGLDRYSRLPAPVKVLYLGTTLASVLLFLFYWLAVPIGGRVLGGTFYYYLLFAILGFNVFIGLAATRKHGDRPPPWYDYLASVALPLLMVFFLLNAEEISMRMWTPAPSLVHVGLAAVLGLLALEAGRRVAGKGYVIVILVAIGYSLFASHMPGRFYGFQLSISDILSSFAFGADGILGLPAAIMGKMVLGFYLFAGVMVGLGGGEFFIKLAVALMGHIRGGPAKVAVLASGFFGTLSGSTIANIAATGSFTIPAMKRMGYPRHYAAATEACASTGGDTMPPVMGGLVFMAAIITNTDYASIMVAALIPSVLYYLGLLVQVDGYAAKAGMGGLPRAEIPSLWATLKEGWPYLASIAFLVFGLLYMRWGTMAPVFASGVMLVLGFASKKTRPTWRKLETALASTAGLLNIGMAIFLSIGFLTISLYKTGLAAGITSWVVSLGGGNVYLILLIGAVFNLIMGMVGLSRSAYLFLAVTMAPAVASLAGIPIIAVHLFIIFYAGLGGLTPPVAINAFVAAGIARADGMRTAWTSLRLGAILFFVPLFFVLQPALIMHGTPLEIVYHTAMAAVGIVLLTSGLEGYLVVIGRLKVWSRVVLGIAGFLIAFPDTILTLAGLGLALVTILALKVRVKQPAGGGRIEDSDTTRDARRTAE